MPTRHITKPFICEECGTTTVPHHGGGLCRNCYMRDYYAKHRPPGTKVKQAVDKDTVRSELVGALKPMMLRFNILIQYEDGCLTVHSHGNIVGRHQF